MALNPLPSLLDPGQIIKRAFDGTEDRIRVDATATFTPSGPLEVSIDQADDTIAIGDGTDLFTGTTVGSSHAIDANIVGGVVSGNFSQAGLSIGIKTTTQTITDVAVPVPLTSFVNRNTMSVRVWGAATVYFGDSTVVYTSGYPKRQFEEISMDIKDNVAVELWAVCAPGQSCEVRIMEIA